MPYKLSEDGKCVHKENPDGSLGDVVKCHDTTEEAAAHLEALNANVEEAMNAVLFTELKAGDLAHAFDGMAVGTFTDRNGRKATFQEPELPAYLANTLAAIGSSKAESGDIVGLPIDMTNHDHQGGAGWIVGAELAGNRIRLIPRWTEEGEAAIRAGKRRFFSPTIDPKEQVILGGSLVNWPGLRDRAGKFAIRPIELSCPDDSTMFFREVPMDDLATVVREFLHRVFPGTQPANPPKEKNMPKDKNDSGTVELADLEEMAGGAEKLQQLVEQKANDRLTELLAAEQAKAEINEFATRLVGGTKDVPFGLPCTKDALVNLLGLVPTTKRAEVMTLLETIWKGERVSFSEGGHGKELTTQGTKLLDPLNAMALADWLAAGKTVEEFFQVAGDELGSQADYNLSAFKVKED